jgi:hypothetical protein
MCKGIVRTAAAVVVCLCAISAAGGAVRPAFVYSADVNAPWVPAEHLSAVWESVTFTSRIYNPEQQSGGVASRSLAVSGKIDVIDPNGLMGLSTTERGILALDQNGGVIYSSSNSKPLTRFYNSPTGLFGSSAASFGVTLPVDANVSYPSRLSKLQWSIDMLVADTTKQIDIPFAVTTEWAEVLPGLEIIVQEATVEGTTYRYRIKARYDSAKVQYSGGMVMVSPGHPLPGTALISTTVLNAQGVSVTDRSTSGIYALADIGSSSDAPMTASAIESSSDTLTTAIMSGSGSCSGCGAATTIRQVFAIDPYEKEVPLVLEDIPVPGI